MKARVIAFYLPQFHPIPENDNWWGKGFTEWTNVGKAKKYFKNHYQPHVPADLGYYDLRVPETRAAQAEMARKHGVEAFCYWHYWFGEKKQLLERPFNEVLNSGEPDFPFCLAWANESWKGFPHGLKNRNTLIEQKYSGYDDYKAHFEYVLKAFQDKRYLKIDDKPMFFIYQPFNSPEISEFIKIWRKLASENGLPGIVFVGNTDNDDKIDEIINLGFDFVNVNRIFQYSKNTNRYINRLKNMLFKGNANVFEYKHVYSSFNNDHDKRSDVFPTIIPGWDHTPRSGLKGLVYDNSTPELFEKHIDRVLELTKEKKKETNFIFLKSWNEWAEGNYVEPDLKWGTKFLESLAKKIF